MTKINLYIFIIFLITPIVAQGATLYFEPISANYYLEDVFTVEIKIDTKEQKINAVNIGLFFNKDSLEIKDFSKGGSILTFWPEEPIISSQEGSISFIGGIPNGFQGKGVLGRIIFKVHGLIQDYAKIEFSEKSQVLLNDGLGTPVDIVTEKAIFNILPERLEIPRDEWKEILEKDNIPPEPFEVIINQYPFLFDGQYFIVFFAVDKQTGIDYYEVKKEKWNGKEQKALIY